MYIKRKLESKILRFLNEPEILAIVGPRQSGKTTLLKRIQADLPGSIFLSFEDLAVLELFEKNIKLFAKSFQSYKYLFIDEFQYAKNGGKNLKYLYDTFPNFKIIISGSSAIDLTVKAIKYLVGRIFVMELFQLSFAEYLSGRDEVLARKLENTDKNAITDKTGKILADNLDDFLVWGAYPRIATAQDAEKKAEIIRNIYNTYFLRDIKDVLGLVDDFKLAKLIELLSLSCGQMTDYNELSKSSGYDFKTLKKYLGILEKTFICQSVRPYFQNKRNEVVKNPKIYFFDSGLRNQSINNFNTFDSRTDKGLLAENFIYTQLVKSGIKINYWRNKNKAEVDFIIHAGKGIIPIEVKAGDQEEMPSGLASFIEKYRPEQAIVLNRSINKDLVFRNCQIKFRPLWFKIF